MRRSCPDQQSPKEYRAFAASGLATPRHRRSPTHEAGFTVPVQAVAGGLRAALIMVVNAGRACGAVADRREARFGVFTPLAAALVLQFARSYWT